MYVGQPGVHRPHRDLDRECRQEGKENQRLRGAGQGQLVPGREVETAARLGVQEDQRDQHQQRTQQRVEEELERRVDFVGPAPDADDEVHRDQGGLEKHIEQQTVKRAEDTNHQAAQNQERAHVLVDTARDDFPAGDHDHQVHKGRQQHEPERDTVQADVVVDVEAPNPGLFLHELHRGRAELEAAVQRQRDHERRKRADQRDPAHHVRMLVTAHCQQDAAKHDGHPYGQAQQSHFYSSFSLC